MATCDSVYMFSSATLATDKKNNKKLRPVSCVGHIQVTSRPGRPLCTMTTRVLFKVHLFYSRPAMTLGVGQDVKSPTDLLQGDGQLQPLGQAE